MEREMEREMEMDSNQARPVGNPIKQLDEIHEHCQNLAENEIAVAILTLATAVLKQAQATELIARGTVEGPSGLEGLAIAIAGDRLENPLGNVLAELLRLYEE